MKTHVWREVEAATAHPIDHRTGVRPTACRMPDPTAPPRQQAKKPYKVPNTNLERRGFTGY